MLYDLNNDYQREEFSNKVNSMLEARHLVELTRKFPNRTLSQNRYLHIIINQYALFVGERAEDVKVDIFKIECNLDLFKVEKIHNGETIYTLKSSRDLTTQEMTVAIERYRNYCANNGCYIPSPDEREYLIYLQREQEKNKEWL